MKAYHKKWLAGFLSVLLLFSVIITPPPVYSQTSAEQEIELINPGFENSSPGDDIDGWSQDGVGGSVSVTDQVYYLGGQSLHLHDMSDEDGLSAISDPFDVMAGTDYRINTLMNVVDQSHSVVFEIRFYDKAGNKMPDYDQRELYRASNKELWQGKWFEIELSATAPANAETASVVFHSGGVSLTEVYFDDVSVYQLGLPPEEEDVEVLNAGFEEQVIDTQVPGWSQIGEGGVIAVSSEETASGKQSLYFHDEDVANTFTVLSDPIPVKPGSAYRANAEMHVLRQTHSVVFELQYFDSDDEMITSSNELYRSADSDTWLNRWFDIMVEASAPAGAEYVRIVFHSGMPSITEAYFDNVTLTRFEQEQDDSNDIHDGYINPGFEEIAQIEGEIPGWNFSDGISQSDEQALSGKYSLKLSDTSTASSVWASSNRIKVTPGLLYNIQANMFVVQQSHNIVFEVSFHDINGASIGSPINVLYGDVEPNTWKNMNVLAEAPAHAAYMQVHFRSGGISLTEAYFDDLSFTAVDRSLENPSAMSDEEFFGQWDADAQSWAMQGKINYTFSEDLAPVEHAVKAGNYEQAGEELLSYYRARDGYQTLQNFADTRDSELVDLVMDRIFTLAGESYATTITVDNDYRSVRGDVTEEVVQELDDAERDSISFILMARHKGSSVAEFHSREHSENPPQLEVEMDGETKIIEAVKDTYIDAQDVGRNFGASKQLRVHDEGVPEELNNSKSYVNFPLEALDGEITQANLILHGINDSGTGDLDVMVYTTRDTGWVEHELTYENHWGKTYSWQGIEGGTDWLRPPHSDNEYYFQIPRFYFANEMMAEYLATNDEGYTDDLIALIMDFIYDSETYGGEQGAGSHPRTLDSAIRAFNWTNAYHVLRETESLDANANTAMLKTFWKTARFLENHFSASNWGVIESKGFYHIAGYFPEFVQSPEWESLILNRLEQLFSDNYMKDGGYVEASTTYASIAINEFINIKKFGSLNNKTFSDHFNMWLQRAGKYLIDIAFPNGIDPVMGDSSSADHRPILMDLANETGDEYLRYVGSSGAEGIAPPYTSTLYPVQLTSVLRSGWKQDDLYLHMNAGTGSHAHPDELGVIVYGYGRPLLVDPGTFSYSHDDISNWLRKTTQAHNTIEINGIAQDGSRGGSMDTLVSNPEFDFLTGETLATPDFVHQRNILFVKPGFWVVSDQVSGGEGTNSYEQNWHFLPRANISLDSDTNKVSTAFADGGAEIQVVPVDSEDVQAYLADGYYSEGFYTVTDAKYASFLKETEGDVTFDTVLYPTPNGDDTEVDVERIDIGVDHNKATALQIDMERSTGHNTGYYYMTYEDLEDSGYAERTIQNYRFDGKSFYVEEGEGGDIQRAILVEGSKLHRDGTALIQFNERITDLNLAWEANQLSVSGKELIANQDTDTATPIYAPNVDEVLLNGEEVPFTREGDFIYAIGLIDPLYSNEMDSVQLDLDESDSFTIEFDLVPAVNETDGWIGLNTEGNCTDNCHTMGIQLLEDGTFQVANGTGQEALISVPYFANRTVKLQLDVNTAGGTYDVYVTPEDGFKTQIAEDYRFNRNMADTDELYMQLLSAQDRDFRVQNLTLRDYDGELGEDPDLKLSIDNPYFDQFDVPGWRFEDPSGGPYVTNQKAYSGNQSLKFITLPDQGNTDVRTPLIPVNGAEGYRLNAKVFMEENVSHTFGVYISTYDAEGNELKNQRHGLGSDQFVVGEWTDISIEEVGSEDTAYVMIRFYTGGVTSMIGYIDEVEIVEIQGETETSVDHDNLGFEALVSLDNWHISGENASVSSADSYIGRYSLEMNQLPGDELSVRSNKIRVNEGETYYGSVHYVVQDDEHEGHIRVTFYDQNANELLAKEQRISGAPSESWQLAHVEATAPEQVAYAIVELSGGDSKGFHAYLDSVGFSTEHPEGDDSGDSYPTDITNAGFEEDLNTDDTVPGWTVTATHPDSTIERSDIVAHSGMYSLYFHDNNDVADLRAQGEKIAVESGKLYLASTEAYILEQSHRIVVELEFFDRNDQSLHTEIGLFNNLPKEVWTTLPVSAIAPPASAYARINFYSGGISFTEVYFDDVRFQMLEQEEPLETNLGEPELVGQPVKVPLAQGGKIKATIEGENEVYMVSNGDPGVFHALDAETGELLFQQALEDGDETVWAMTFAPNGDLYFASDSLGILYRYDPIAKEMESVPGRVPTDTKVWALTSTDDGKLYGGTYPGATVFEYNTSTGEFKSFGRVHPTEQYVRGITATDSHIYAAVGSNKHLFKIDRETGEQEEVIIQSDQYPDHQSGESGFYSDIWVMEGKLFIQSGSGTMLVVEEDTLEVIQKFDVSDQISQPSPYEANLIYFKNEEDLYTYNLATNEVKKLEGLDPLPDTPRVKSFEWITLNEGEHAGRTVLAVTTQYSEYFLYDPVEHQIRYIPLEVEPQAVNIQALEISPDNKLYVGGFQRGLTIMDPETDDMLETIGTFRQAEGIGFKENVAYFGTYTGAQIYRYDPSQSVNFGTAPDNNPGFVFDMGDEQDRPFVVTSSDNHVFIGSVPGYGLLGGSLAIYDERTGSWKSYHNVVDQQSIIGLAYKDGLLYGGTSIWGGQGGAPSEVEAKMFIWDVEAGEKIEEFTLDIPDIDQAPKMIGALSFDQDGLLWGAIDGTIFAMDVETKEIVKSKVIIPSTYDSSKWRPHYIRWGADGYMYTTLSRELVVIDPETLQHKVFNELGAVHNMTIAADGTVYYADATSELYKMPFTGNPVEPGQPENQATLRLSGPERLQPGMTFALDLNVDQVEDVYGASVELSYDPEVLRVVDADESLDGIQIETGDLLSGSVIRNDVDTEAGIITFAVTQLGETPGISGEGTLATVHVEVTEDAQGDVTVKAKEDNITLVNSRNTDIPFNITNYTASIHADQEGVLITGSVELPETHSLNDLSGYTIKLTQGGTVVAQTETDANGNFQLFFNGKAGHFDLVVAKNNYLTVKRNLEVKPGTEKLDASTTIMYVGDFNGDGQINIADIYQIAKVYNKTVTDGLHMYDVDGDGKIDKQDVTTVVQHFQQRSE